MMRSYNKKIIPIFIEESDKRYVDDLIRSSPDAFSSDKKVREYIQDYRLTRSDKLLDKLIKMYGRYVISIAKNYQSQGLPLCDLISEGMLGLLNAIDNYDTDHVTKFVTYSNTVISRQMREALDVTNNPVHIPKNIRNLKSKAKELVNTMAGKGAEPYDILDEVEDDQMEYVVNPQIHKKFRLSDRVSGADSTGDRTHEDTLESAFVHPDSELHKSDLIKLLDAIFKSKLTGAEAQVLRMFFGMDAEYAPLSIRDIGTFMQLSGERARQLKESGLKKLRSDVNKALLCEYL